MLERGSRLGDYEILDVLGEGESAVTYRARRLTDATPVALKVAHRHHAADPTFYFRFAREAALGRRLNHPGIVRVPDSGEEREELFIAMELVEGTLLGDELAARGRLPLLTALGVAREVADALAHAHAQGVVHRNLKPGHIMLVRGGGAKVMDLGVARDFGQIGLTRTDVQLGSPLYSAPEAKEPARLDHQSDLYSLGIILYEMLQGRPPFTAISPVEVAILHCTAPFPRPEELEVPVPRAVWELMSRLCDKQPERRPRLAVEVVRELDRIVGLVGRRG